MKFAKLPNLKRCFSGTMPLCLLVLSMIILTYCTGTSTSLKPGVGLREADYEPSQAVMRTAIAPKQQTRFEQISEEEQKQERKIEFKIVKRKFVDDTLILSVMTSENLESLTQDEKRNIASELVKSNPGEYMIRVFFYDQDEKPGKDPAKCRYEWTKAKGLVLSYDLSKKRVKKDIISMDFPNYVILNSFALISGGHYGDILIPSFSTKTAVKERREAAEKITQKEGFKEACFYSTEEAYEANWSESYLRSHPNALKEGFLGSYKNGVFIPGEAIY